MFRWLPHLSLSLLLLAPAPLWAQATDTPPPDMAQIEQAWINGDFEAARAGLKILAEEQGSAQAQYRYGRILFEGRGGPRDLKASVDWLRQAVAQDYVPAYVLLARIYLSAQNAEAPAAAADLLQRAAARGEAEAKYYLALLYREGRGVEQDPNLAFTWMLAAAEQEYGPAQYELSQDYAGGRGTQTDQNAAMSWLTRAATNGEAVAQLRLGLILMRNPETKAQASQWLTQAAQGGHVQAQRVLGTQYLQGDGIEQDFEKARQWLTVAADAGSPGAQINLGHIYAQGLGVAQDDARAVQLYDLAAGGDAPQAMMALGQMYDAGRGGPGKGLAQAIRLFRQAGDMGFGPATLHLGQMAIDGRLDGQVAPQSAVPWVAATLAQGAEGARDWLAAQAAAGNRPAQTALGLYLANLERPGPQDITEAASLLEQASEAGDANAQARLGQLYATGTGVDLDYGAAYKWLNIAATQGISAAAELRGTLTELMTPEEVAAAQTATRDWLAAEASRAPQTHQKVSE